MSRKLKIPLTTVHRRRKRLEKEFLEIAELHTEGKSSKEISKIVHKNFTFIGAVLRKRFPEEYADADNSENNKETEALKLFSERKSPTEVAIKLGLSYEDTEKATRVITILNIQNVLENNYSLETL